MKVHLVHLAVPRLQTLQEPNRRTARAHLASLRAAFSNLRIVREQIIVDDNFRAARNSFSCDFTDVFTYSPIGHLEPTGEHLG